MPPRFALSLLSEVQEGENTGAEWHLPEMMNEFVKSLLSVFSLLECSASLSAPFGPLTKGMAGSFSPLTKGVADHLAGHVQEVKVAATELLPSCWNDIRQGKQCENQTVKQKHLAQPRPLAFHADS